MRKLTSGLQPCPYVAHTADQGLSNCRLFEKTSRCNRCTYRTQHPMCHHLDDADTAISGMRMGPDLSKGLLNGGRWFPGAVRGAAPEGLSCRRCRRRSRSSGGVPELGPESATACGASARARGSRSSGRGRGDTGGLWSCQEASILFRGVPRTRGPQLSGSESCQLFQIDHGVFILSGYFSFNRPVTCGQRNGVL